MLAKADGPPKRKALSANVDGQFFETWWPKKFDKFEIEGRPSPTASNKNNRRSLPALLFEALESKTHRTDFVLCNDEMNGYKGRLWQLINPMDTKRFNEIAKDAANGAIPSVQHLIALRAVSISNAVPQKDNITNMSQDSGGVCVYESCKR